MLPASTRPFTVRVHFTAPWCQVRRIAAKRSALVTVPATSAPTARARAVDAARRALPTAQIWQADVLAPRTGEDL